MQVIEKGWGREEIFVSNEKYCGKFLHFNKGAKFSMHFHAEKEETWYVMSGLFILKRVNTDNAEVKEVCLRPKETWTNYPLEPHQLICIEEGTILEVSTEDSSLDNYRVFPGDSQK
jgi:mannose-6-phosphate isomerase-like protein (cupin superfamily)